MKTVMRSLCVLAVLTVLALVPGCKDPGLFGTAPAPEPCAATCGCPCGCFVCSGQEASGCTCVEPCCCAGCCGSRD